MKFELTESCTDETLTVDGLVIDDKVPNYILKLYINTLTQEMPPKDLVYFITELIIKHHKVNYELLGHCETCGDTPYKYSLEL